MNVCFIAPQVIKAVSGGLCTQVEYTANFLQNLGLNVTFYNQWKTYNWKQFDLAHIFRADFETYNMARFLNESNVPFVVSPVFFNLNNSYIIRLYLKLSKIMQLVFKGLSSDFDYLYRISHLSSQLLPNTHSESKFMQRCLDFPKSKITVVPNGVENRFENADPSLFIKKYKVNEFILTVGNLGYERKNILNLLIALEKIDHPSVVIGKIYKNEYGLKCLNIINRNKHILWIDAISHDDPILESAYAACKVFALPSYFETPGIAALEAALTGANIVITPYGGTKEYFQDMAEYVNPRKIDSIKNCIIKALSKNRNSQLKNHILENFTWPIVAKKTFSSYKKI